MTTTSKRTTRNDLSRASTRRLVEDVLDGLDVAERAYHHLNFNLPLVADLVWRVRRSAQPGERVLVIGGSTLLAETLNRLEYELVLWQFPETHLTEGIKPLVLRHISPETLAQFEPDQERYQVIVVPLVLESLQGEPEPFLRKLRRQLAPSGTLIAATGNQTRLDHRLAALMGKSFTSTGEAAALSLSWPAIAKVRELHAEQLASISRAAGFLTRRLDYVVGDRAFLEMEPLNLQDYALRKVRSAITSAVPGTRDVIVAELSPRAGDDIPIKSRTESPRVSVFVSVSQGGDGLRQALSALLNQTFPADRLEIVVLHDGSKADVHTIVSDAQGTTEITLRETVLPTTESPMTRNLAMAETDSDISAHMDDLCRPPEDWIDSALAWFDADTGTGTGPVFLRDGSESRFLEVPGSRPDPDDKGMSPQAIFPIVNVFYRTGVAQAVGGFDHSFSQNGGEPSLGWDTELAWRLHRSGWRARFREEVYQLRLYPPDTSRNEWVRKQIRSAEQLPAFVARVPEFGRASLVSGVFASKETMYFDFAAAGIVLAAAGRRWPLLLLCLPYLATLNPRVDIWPPSNWRGSVRTVSRITMRQAVWLVGFIRGSIKARRLVL